jgi:TetR/AcrR family transcriptional regulator, cholesterol catabolism regulator
MSDPMPKPETPPKRRAPRASKGSSRTPVYSSPLIIARRNRILDETRKMIGKQGIASISMDEVAKRAGVAKRTLYNAFQSKEHLIALAINKYFEDYSSKIEYSTADATLEWMIERLIIVARRNLAIKNYTRVLMNIYYASDVDPEIRQAIHEIASTSHEVWVAELARKNQLQPWLTADGLTDMLVRYRYATAHSWTEGRIPDELFLRELLVGFLTFMAGATIGAARKEILAALADIDDRLAREMASAPKSPKKAASAD